MWVGGGGGCSGGGGGQFNPRAPQHHEAKACRGQSDTTSAHVMHRPPPVSLCQTAPPPPLCRPHILGMPASHPTCQSTVRLPDRRRPHIARRMSLNARGVTRPSVPVRCGGMTTASRGVSRVPQPMETHSVCTGGAVGLRWGCVGVCDVLRRAPACDG